MLGRFGEKTKSFLLIVHLGNFCAKNCEILTRRILSPIDGKRSLMDKKRFWEGFVKKQSHLELVLVGVMKFRPQAFLAFFIEKIFERFGGKTK